METLTHGDEIEVPPPDVAEEGVMDAGDVGGGDGGGYTRQVQEEAGLGHLPTPRRS